MSGAALPDNISGLGEEGDELVLVGVRALAVCSCESPVEVTRSRKKKTGMPRRNILDKTLFTTTTPTKEYFRGERTLVLTLNSTAMKHSDKSM
jgi:hypothetical protein